MWLHVGLRSDSFPIVFPWCAPALWLNHKTAHEHFHKYLLQKSSQEIWNPKTEGDIRKGTSWEAVHVLIRMKVKGIGQRDLQKSNVEDTVEGMEMAAEQNCACKHSLSLSKWEAFS